MYTKVVLKNGLTILVEEFKSNPVVSIQTHIRAGFLNETDARRVGPHASSLPWYAGGPQTKTPELSNRTYMPSAVCSGSRWITRARNLKSLLLPLSGRGL